MHAKGDKIRVAKKVDSKHRNIVLGIGTYCKNKLMMVEKTTFQLWKLCETFFCTNAYKFWQKEKEQWTVRWSMKIFYVKEYFLNGWKLWHTWWQRPFNVYLLMRVLQMKPIDLSRLPPKYLRVVHKCRLYSFCYQAI